MIVRMRLDVSDKERKALRFRADGKGLATRKELVQEMESVLDSHFMDLVFDYEVATGPEEESDG